MELASAEAPLNNGLEVSLESSQWRVESPQWRVESPLLRGLKLKVVLERRVGLSLFPLWKETSVGAVEAHLCDVASQD
jgi:hypothetical protein